MKSAPTIDLLLDSFFVENVFLKYYPKVGNGCILEADFFNETYFIVRNLFNKLLSGVKLELERFETIMPRKRCLDNV